jgi:hypothetical protein
MFAHATPQESTTVQVPLLAVAPRSTCHSPGTGHVIYTCKGLPIFVNSGGPEAMNTLSELLFLWRCCVVRAPSSPQQRPAEESAPMALNIFALPRERGTRPKLEVRDHIPLLLFVVAVGDGLGNGGGHRRSRHLATMTRDRATDCRYILRRFLSGTGPERRHPVTHQHLLIFTLLSSYLLARRPVLDKIYSFLIQLW